MSREYDFKTKRIKIKHQITMRNVGNVVDIQKEDQHDTMFRNSPLPRTRIQISDIMQNDVSYVHHRFSAWKHKLDRSKTQIF